MVHLFYVQSFSFQFSSTGGKVSSCNCIGISKLHIIGKICTMVNLLLRWINRIGFKSLMPLSCPNFTDFWHNIHDVNLCVFMISYRAFILLLVYNILSCVYFSSFPLSYRENRLSCLDFLKIELDSECIRPAFKIE